MKESRSKTKPDPKLKLKKIQLRAQLTDEFEKKINNILVSWKKQQESFTTKANEFDSQLDNMQTRIENIYNTIYTKLSAVKNGNRIMEEKIEQQKALKRKLQQTSETNNIEISAEINLELQRQKRAAELHCAVAENKRLLDKSKREKVELKKKYLRAITQYNKLKAEEEERVRVKRALKKKAYLEQKLKEREEEERRAIQAENDPKNKYKALLAAAGHIDGDSSVHQVETRAPLIYQPADTPAISDPRVIIETHETDDGLWLENNIRTLLSTGNYTEDDPVIRGLKAQLHRARYQ